MGWCDGAVSLCSVIPVPKCNLLDAGASVKEVSERNTRPHRESPHGIRVRAA